MGVDIAPNGDNFVAYHDGGGHAIARLDRNGDRIWAYGWGSPAGAWLYEERVAATPAGGAVLTGTLTAQDYSYSKIVLRRLAANGTVERYAEWSFPNSLGTYGYSFAPDGKGGFWLGGNYSRNETSSGGVFHSDSDIYVAHFNADLGGAGGTAVPDRVYSVSGSLSGPSGDDPANESVGELRCFPDGTVAVLHAKEGAAASLWTTAIKPDGSRATIPLGSTGDPNVYAVMKGGVAWDGANVVVASGVRQPNGSYRATLRKFGFDGALKWSASPEAAGSDAFLASVDVTPAGNVVAGGFNTVPGLDREFRVYRYGPAGALLATHDGLQEFGDYARTHGEYCETVRASTVDEAVIAVGRWFAPDGTLPGYVGPPNAFTGSIQIAEIQPDGASNNWVWGSGARNLPGGLQTTANGRLALAITLGDTPVLWAFRRFVRPTSDDFYVRQAGPITVPAATLLANDKFLADATGLETTQQPLHGTLVGSGPNLIYTPNPGYRGGDLFQYRIRKPGWNTTLYSAVTTVFLGQDTPPVAVDDFVATRVGEAVEMRPLGNDLDPDGDPISIASVSAPSNGARTRFGNVLRYTPKPGFVGDDVVTYTVGGSPLFTSTATVTFRVAAPPTITGLSPKTVLAGTPAFDLTVYGADFSPDAQVSVDGAARTTTFVSSTTVRTRIEASAVAQARVLKVQVRTGGQDTAAALLDVRAIGTLALKGSALRNAAGFSGELYARATNGDVPNIRIARIVVLGQNVIKSILNLGTIPNASGTAILYTYRSLDPLPASATALVEGTIDGRRSAPP